MLDNKEKILKVFFDSPTKVFHIREIARKTKLNPNTVLNLLADLIKNKIVKREKKKHLVNVSALVNENFQRLKRVNNLKVLYDSGLVDFLVDKFSPEAVSVMGSYSWGEDIENSDVDIVVVSSKEKILDLSKFEKKIARKVHLIVVDYKTISKEFYINLINGVVLYGYLNKK